MAYSLSAGKVASHAVHQATPIRFITATSLFDGHDAAINIMAYVMECCAIARHGKSLRTGQQSLDNDWNSLAKLLTGIENSGIGTAKRRSKQKIRLAGKSSTPILGITGTGGAGKSLLTDELIQRLRRQYQDRYYCG